MSTPPQPHEGTVEATLLAELFGPPDWRQVAREQVAWLARVVEETDSPDYLNDAFTAVGYVVRMHIEAERLAGRLER